MEQAQYHLLERYRVETDYARLYEELGYGLTTWSPLASGLLSGKYLDGVPEGSRGTLEGYEWLRDLITDERALDRVRNLVPIAEQLGCTMSQLAIAWVARNPNVSSVILGASKVTQLEENLAALDVVPLLDENVLARIDAALAS